MDALHTPPRPAARAQAVGTPQRPLCATVFNPATDADALAVEVHHSAPSVGASRAGRPQPQGERFGGGVPSAAAREPATAHASCGCMS